MLKTDQEWQKIFEKVNDAAKVFDVKMSDWQIDAMMYSLRSPITIDLTELEEMNKAEEIKVTGDKRNGTMSRQQAFGGLLENRRWHNK